MSEREYLISKASRGMEEYKEGRKRAVHDPAFLAAGAAGAGGSGAMFHALYANKGKGRDAVNAAETAARKEGKKGWQAVKPALKVMPKRYWVGAGTAAGGIGTMNARNAKHRRDIISERG